MNIIALASGSTGNSTLVRWEGGSLLIDAGISARRISTMLRASAVGYRLSSEAVPSFRNWESSIRRVR